MGSFKSSVSTREAFLLISQPPRPLTPKRKFGPFYTISEDYTSLEVTKKRRLIAISRECHTTRDFNSMDWQALSSGPRVSKRTATVKAATNISDHDEAAESLSPSFTQQGQAQPNRPTLDAVLNNTAPPPYTLAAFTAFLSQQHCLEVLEFVTEARRYGSRYNQVVAEIADPGEPLTTESDDGFELINMWNRLLDVYVKPGAPREINLPAEERDDLVTYPEEPLPPGSDVLEPAIRRMYDLMADSIFIPFCNSLQVPSQAQTYSAVPELRRTDFDPARMSSDETSPDGHT